MFFDWKIQLEKVQLTRDLNDDPILYLNDDLIHYQGFCDSTTRTHARIVWFPEDPCTTFQAKIHDRMIKFHQKYFIESIPFENVNPGKIKHSN